MIGEACELGGMVQDVLKHPSHGLLEVVEGGLLIGLLSLKIAFGGGGGDEEGCGFIHLFHEDANEGKGTGLRLYKFTRSDDGTKGLDAISLLSVEECLNLG